VDVNKDLTRYEDNGNILVVVIDCDTLEEANNTEARNLAQKAAAEHGLANVALNPTTHGYAVDAATNKPLDEPYPGVQIACYRVEHRCAKRL
jgi:hypothetical protein